MKVAVLGPPGTYTHKAANAYFSDYTPVFCQTLREVIEQNDMVGIIPFENSLGGGVDESCDLLREYGPTITGEHLLEINHCLLSQSSFDDVERVRSHPQALDQCRSFIEEYGWDTVEAPSTARAADELRQGEAAIASNLAADLYNLRVLERDIQDRTSVTRFFILRGESTEPEKTSFIVEPGSDAPGLLHEMLGCFAAQNINLSYIQSRPTKQKMGEYYFYIEAEEPRGTKQYEKAKECLDPLADIRVLGSYNGADTV